MKNAPALKLGRLPKRDDPRTLKLAAYLPAIPPVPPLTCDVASAVGSWPMYQNDKLADCTAAAAGHMIEVWSAQAGKPVVPSDADVLAFYELQGYSPSNPSSDTGAVVLDVLRAWRTTGLGGDKVYAFASVDVTKVVQIKAACWLFGGLMLGISLPRSAQAQIGGLWDADSSANGTPGSWGGHCVPMVSYSELEVGVVTWGKYQRMSWKFWLQYVEEAWAVIPSEYAAATASASGLAFADLQADLAALGNLSS